MLIPGTAVEFVEFMKYDNEVEASEEELKEAEDLLVACHQKEDANGSEGPTATAQPS